MNEKKLGFGMMRLPSLDPHDPSKIDIEETKKMVDAFLKEVLLILILHGCIVDFKVKMPSKMLWFHAILEIALLWLQNYILDLLKQRKIVIKYSISS